MTRHRARENGLFQASSATRWIAGGAAALAGFFGVAFAWPQLSAAHGNDPQVAPDSNVDGYAPDPGAPGPTAGPTTPSRSGPTAGPTTPSRSASPSTTSPSARSSAGASSSAPSTTPSTATAPTQSRRRPRAVTGAS